MKRIFTLLALAALTLSVLAQSPDLMSYQAVLRDAQDHLLQNQAVAVQISILQGAPNGTAVYTEVHALNTNDNGLISLMIGDGVTSDDFSTIDWGAGPYFIKTETDPAGGSNYTITSTTQLVSVPYAKYAGEAGNVFSGNYGDLTGAPTDVSVFTNDAGYLTTVTGSETAFNGWDKDVTDDFSGNYADLSGSPWNLNGSNVYFQGGNVGVGTSTPNRIMVINSGAGLNYLTFQNNGTGTGVTDGFMVGNETDMDGFVWNWENAPIHFGTSNNFRMILTGAGDVGIGTTTPTARLDVRGGAKIGATGVVIGEMREITGVTGSYQTTIPLPTGYTEDNTRVLIAEVQLLGDRWVGLGSHFRALPTGSLYNLSYLINGTTLYLFVPNEADYLGKAYRIIIMQVL